MKNPFSYIFALILILFSSILISCEKIDLMENSSTIINDKNPSNVRIITRAADGSTITYPLHVFAFGENGNLHAKQVVNSDSEDLNLRLSKTTDYTVVAISGDANSFDIPSSPTVSSVIKMKETGNYSSSTPLQIGIAEITTGDSDASIYMQMRYAVASFNATLSNMPDNCSSVSITISSPYEGITMNNKGNGSKKAKILCSKIGTGVWSTGTTYIYPTSDTQTNFSICYNDGYEEHISTAMYNDVLKASTPYIINGTFEGNNQTNEAISIKGIVTPPEWAAQVNMNLVFNETEGAITSEENNGGGNEGETDKGSETPSSDNINTYQVNAIPEQFSIWEGHIVLDVTNNTGNTAELLLLSLTDWSKMTAASNESYSAGSIASSYKEYDIENWSLPSEEQARHIYQIYHDYDKEVDKTIVTANADAIKTTEGNDNIRYLCENGTKTFGFNSNRILGAGASVSTYHLRLVKTVRVVKEE